MKKLLIQSTVFAMILPGLARAIANFFALL